MPLYSLYGDEFRTSSSASAAPWAGFVMLYGHRLLTLPSSSHGRMHPKANVLA
jgi:hypothetical protein